MTIHVTIFTLSWIATYLL